MPIRLEIKGILDLVKSGATTELNLASTMDIEIDEIKAITDALKHPNCKVTLVYIPYYQLGDEGAKVIAEAIQDQNCKMTKIILNSSTYSNGRISFNKNLAIGDEGVKALALALQNPNCKVTSINLSENDIGDEGAKALALALQNPNCKVTSINLSENDIGDEGAKALALALQNPNCKVTSINLGGNIGDEGVKVLAEALKINSTVTKIDLLGNKNITTIGARAFAKALEVNKTIFYIDFPDCGIEATIALQAAGVHVDYCDISERKVYSDPLSLCNRIDIGLSKCIDFAFQHKRELLLAGVAACAILAACYKKPELLTNLKDMFFGMFEKASSFVMGK